MSSHNHINSSSNRQTISSRRLRKEIILLFATISVFVFVIHSYLFLNEQTNFVERRNDQESDLFIIPQVSKKKAKVRSTATAATTTTTTTTTTTSATTHPYQPKLLDTQKHQTDEDSSSSWHGIHILRSRFQQGQADLTKLGWARYALFRDFCFPSILAQSTDNFIWLVYTDPELDDGLLQAMTSLLQPHSNFFLIQSLENTLWNGGQAESLQDATVYTGNQTLLEKYMALRDTVPVLETKLDADDAIHREYLETIQGEAVQQFYHPKQQNHIHHAVRWMYWCVKMELQWYWLGPKGMTTKQRQYGILDVMDNVDFCPMPGMTIGYNAGVKQDTIYQRKHSKLIQSLNEITDNDDNSNNDNDDDNTMCGIGRKGRDCYQIITKFPYPAMRTRTPTSNSMAMIRHTKNELKTNEGFKGNAQTEMFQLLANDFGIAKEDCAKSSQHFTDHIAEITEEALVGTCTGLFGCNEKAAGRLEKVMGEYGRISTKTTDDNAQQQDRQLRKKKNRRADVYSRG